MQNSTQQGFTLIEVLVALAIIAIALIATIKTVIYSTQNANYIKEKTISLWMAQNAMASIQLYLKEPPIINEPISLLNRNWFWSAIEENTANPYVEKIKITIQKHKSQTPILRVYSYKEIIPSS